MSSRLLAEALRRADFDVVLCKTAHDCEAEMQRAPNADLVVTSILLPDEDGLTLTRRLRAMDPQVRILVVSALRATTRALQAGADQFLSKPVSIPLFLAAVQELVPPGGARASGRGRVRGDRELPDGSLDLS